MQRFREETNRMPTELDKFVDEYIKKTGETKEQFLSRAILGTMERDLEQVESLLLGKQKKKGARSSV